MKSWLLRHKRKGLLLLALIVAGAVLTQIMAKRLGYRGAWDFITSYGNHMSRGWSADAETIEIIIDKSDYKKIEKIRDQAVAAGMQIPVEDACVKGKLTYKGREIKIKLRLKGHMTDHLQGKKWSFRIKTRKGDAFRGMQLFTIQHPGTRGYAYEWLFHEVMRREGLIALQYDFINVKLNGENLGVYALEENFGEELIERNLRPKGPVLRFNPDLYWVFRYDELQGDPFLHESGNWKSSYLEPYDDKNVYGDSSMLRAYSEAIDLMQAFRSGKTSTAGAFDYKALAMYHAWIDIIGGTHSLDWTDVKYYYNPVRRLFEPVVYESFSAFPVYSLCGQFRMTGDTLRRDDLHNLLFSDTTFYAEYIRQLVRMSDAKWISSTLKSVDKDLQKKLDVLYSEWPHRNFKTDIYRSNAKRVRKMLSMPSYVNVFFAGIKRDSLLLRVACVDGLPVVPDAVELAGKKYKPYSTTWIPSKGMSDAPVYRTYAFHVADSVLTRLQSDFRAELLYHVPGTNRNIVTRVLNRIPGISIEQEYGMDMRSAPFAETDEKKKNIFIRPGKYEITHAWKVNKGYTLRVGPATTLDFKEGASLRIHGNLVCEGTEELPVSMVSSDSSGMGIYADGNVRMSHTLVSGMRAEAALLCYGNEVRLTNCRFLQNETALALYNTLSQVKNTAFASCRSHAMELFYGKVVCNGIVVKKCWANGIKNTGADLRLNDSEIADCRKSGIRSELFAMNKGARNKISKCKTGIMAINGAQFTMTEVSINNCETGIRTEQKKDSYGSAIVTLSKSQLKKCKTEIKKETGTSVVVGK